MKKIEELQKTFNELEKELKQLGEAIAQALSAEDADLWEKVTPRFGETYYFMNSMGIVLADTWGGGYIDDDRLKMGSVSKTKTDAEFKIEKQKVETELRLFSKNFEYGAENWFIYFDHENDWIASISVASCQYTPIIFESEEQAKKAVEFVGEERIKKYYFGVEDK